MHVRYNLLTENQLASIPYDPELLH